MCVMYCMYLMQMLHCCAHCVQVRHVLYAYWMIFVQIMIHVYYHVKLRLFLLLILFRVIMSIKMSLLITIFTPAYYGPNWYKRHQVHFVIWPNIQNGSGIYTQLHHCIIWSMKYEDNIIWMGYAFDSALKYTWLA